jgi:uncharacterized membrane protein YqaE (UPF0057 family)
MRYFLAIILPPVAVLLCGKPIQFVLNCFLTLLIWIPGMIHALMVVSSHKADQRTNKIVRAINQSARSTAGSPQRLAVKRQSGPSFDFLDK